MRSVQMVLVMVGVVIGSWLGVLDVAHAQTTTQIRVSETKQNGATKELLAELLYQGPALEHAFVEGQLSLWLPGFWTFDTNHTTSVQVGAEAGVQFLHLWRHHFYFVGGLLISPQALEQHLGADASTMVTPWIGLRYISDSLCDANGTGCAFAEVGAGLTFEITADEDENHHAPNGAWTALFGLGYRRRIGAHAHLGARIDFAYLDDTWTSELAWITPTFFGGTSF